LKKRVKDEVTEKGLLKNALFETMKQDLFPEEQDKIISNSLITSPIA
jgi:hypothetical protein